MLSWGCGAHMGDILFTLSYLRKCQGEHTLHVLSQYVDDLLPLVADCRVRVADAGSLPPNAEDTWMANGRHEAQHGLYFRNQEDIMGFIFDYFNCFGKAWEAREDMLFEWPWLRREQWRDLVLILNTQPMSGQCPGYSQEEVNQLATNLRLDGQRVVRVCDDQGNHKYSLTQIACLSAQAKLIIGGASGPFFITMNTAAKDAHRIVFLDPMVIDYGPNVGPVHNVRNASQAREVLKACNYMRYL